MKLRTYLTQRRAFLARIRSLAAHTELTLLLRHLEAGDFEDEPVEIGEYEARALRVLTSVRKIH